MVNSMIYVHQQFNYRSTPIHSIFDHDYEKIVGIQLCYMYIPRGMCYNR